MLLEPSQPFSPFTDLSFASTNPKGLWRPTCAGGTWGEQNIVGRQCADEMMAYIKKHSCPELLGNIVHSMIERGEYGGIEVGFFLRIANGL